MLVINKNDDGSLVLSDTFVNKIQFESIGVEYVYTIYMLKDILTLNDFKYVSEGELNSRNFKVEYSFAQSNRNNWGDWLCLEQGNSNTIPTDISPDKYYDIKIKWTRIGSSDSGVIKLNSFFWSGTYLVNSTNSTMVNLAYNQTIVVKPQNLYKIFNITNLTVTTKGETENSKLVIKYRYTQTKNMYWSDWELLNYDNITTLRLTPIKFVWFEFQLTRTGTEQNGYIGLLDINLIGDIQNVTADSLKTNLFSLRDCCKKDGMGAANVDSLIPLQSGNSCEVPDIFKNIMSDADTLGKLYKPYNLKKDTQFLSALNVSVNQIFGVAVTYFTTSPDKKGIDYTMHEYQLYNVDNYKDIKVTVDKNQFPDNQITFNMYDLGLFETFEIQISKEVFKHVFGIDKRPTKEDFLYFCDLSRMFQVEHTQAYRDMNNTSTYYKVMLTKFNQKSNVIGQSDSIVDMIKSITANTTTEELFGTEMKNDKKNVAFKPEMKTLSNDLVRHKIGANINKELLENSDLVISKNYYDLSSAIDGSDISVKYFNSDAYLRKGDNRAITVWFRFPNYVVNEVYNLISNYNTDISEGYKINIYGDKITFTLNNTDYQLDITDSIYDNVWYCYIVNIDQRDRNVTQYLYTRNVDFDKQYMAKNLNSSVLKLLNKYNTYLEPSEFEFDVNTTNLNIYKSNMHLTNIKIFNVTLDEKIHTKILNQNVIREAQYIILCDICNNKINLVNYPLN